MFLSEQSRMELLVGNIENIIENSVLEKKKLLLSAS